MAEPSPAHDDQIDEVVARATTVLRLTEVLGPHIELLRDQFEWLTVLYRRVLDQSDDGRSRGRLTATRRWPWPSWRSSSTKTTSTPTLRLRT